MRVSRLIRGSLRRHAAAAARPQARGMDGADEQDIRALMAAAGMQERATCRAGQGAGRVGALELLHAVQEAPRGARQGASQNAPQRGRGAGASAQPDPMKTSFGYIGADSSRQRLGQKRSASRKVGADLACPG